MLTPTQSPLAWGGTRTRRVHDVATFARAGVYVVKYAKAVGLTWERSSRADASNNNGFAYGRGFYGPFGPNQYCGTIRRPIFKVVDGKRKAVGTKKVHRCTVPPYVVTVLTVTYSATSPTDHLATHR